MTQLEQFTDLEFIGYLTGVADDLDQCGQTLVAEDIREAAKRIGRPTLPKSHIVVKGPQSSIGCGQTLTEAFDEAKERCAPELIEHGEFHGHVVFYDSHLRSVDLGELSDVELHSEGRSSRAAAKTRQGRRSRHPGHCQTVCLADCPVAGQAAVPAQRRKTAFGRR